MGKHPIRVLLIEDDPGDVMLISEMLLQDDRRSEIIHASRLEEGIALLSDNNPDIVILDLGLPDSRGISTLMDMYDTVPEVPIVVLTGLSDNTAGIEAVRAGAQDYLIKGQIDSRVLVRSIAYAIERKRSELTIQRLKQQNVLLQDEIKAQKYFECMIAATPKMLSIFEVVLHVSKTDSSVVIYGDTGTGKELIANALYAMSARNDKPFLKINCAAIPETLLESELFGYEKGAFTGAMQRRKGKFEAADGGTILLDEIGEMPLPIQAKMLRVLESRTFERLGGNDPVSVDLRIIYATSKDLLNEVHEGRFREDLFYRINSISIKLPPLRERKEDIPLLTNYFLEFYSKKYGKTGLGFEQKAISALLKHDYPGNIRELKHIIETAVILCRESVIKVEHLHIATRGAKQESPGGIESEDHTLQESVKLYERQAIINALDKTGGKKQEAADMLGISRETLWRKLKEHKLEQYPT
jgi:two-component system NtrC family response regulator/two-component system response regulator HydG/two-component system response regulator AtoC